MNFRLPDLTHRVSINGRTGSGKTVIGAWLLSLARFDLQPFVIIDYKREKLLESIDRARDLDFSAKLPKESGVYILRAFPGASDEAVEQWLWRALRRGSIGVYIDEGYQLPKNSNALRAILTMGRSLRIPTTVISQRPVQVPRAVFSECDFYSCFHLNDQRDRDVVGEFTPNEKENTIWSLTRRLPPYYSRWYDIGRDFSCILKPAPSPEQILATFERRLKPRFRWL